MGPQQCHRSFKRTSSCSSLSRKFLSFHSRPYRHPSLKSCRFSNILILDPARLIVCRSSCPLRQRRLCMLVARGSQTGYLTYTTCGLQAPRLVYFRLVVLSPLKRGIGPYISMLPSGDADHHVVITRPEALCGDNIVLSPYVVRGHTSDVSGSFSGQGLLA